jgi:hypothetical protein
MADEIRGIVVSGNFSTGYPGSKDYEWSYFNMNGMGIKKGDMVTIISEGTTYEVIGEVYSLRVGPDSDTLSVLGSDNHIHALSAKEYYEARNLYLELYDGKSVSIELNTPTNDGGCHHFHQETVVGCVLLEEYTWKRCLTCKEEV